MSKPPSEDSGSTGQQRLEEADRKKDLLGLDADLPDPALLLTIRAEDITILKEIGSGSFGMVYAADFVGTKVALKRIPIAGVDIVRESRLFERELMVFKSLRHPNIVSFIGICELPATETSAFPQRHIVMEYMDRGDLRAFLSAQPSASSISWERKVAILRDIVRAMAYMHSRNIVYRDLKCKNILINKLGQVKLSDFGLSRRFHIKGPIRMESYVGSQGFMAPEIIQGREYTESVDVFSFGIVLFEVSTVLLRVHASIKRSEADGGVDFATIEDKKAFPEDTPRGIKDLFHRCCATNGANRPAFRRIGLNLKELKRQLKARSTPQPPAPPSRSSSLSITPPSASSSSPLLLVPPRRRESGGSSGHSSDSSPRTPTEAPQGIGLGGVFFTEASRKLSDEVRSKRHSLSRKKSKDRGDGRSDGKPSPPMKPKVSIQDPQEDEVHRSSSANDGLVTSTSTPHSDGSRPEIPKIKRSKSDEEDPKGKTRGRRTISNPNLSEADVKH